MPDTLANLNPLTHLVNDPDRRNACLCRTTAEFLAGRPLLATVAAGSAFSVPLLIAFLQARWKTTPGKELFQIRIVDMHGLTPTRAALGTRTILPFLLLWHFAFQAVSDSIGLPVVGYFVGIVALMAIGFDVVTMLVRSDRRGIHDLIAGTQVVLDTKGKSKSTGPAV